MQKKAEIKGKDKRHLRALGHSLKPIVMVGKEGITAGVVAATEQGLEDHELVKVKCGSQQSNETSEAAIQLANATGSLLAQVLGNTILLYKAHPENPKIVLPKDA